MAAQVLLGVVVFNQRGENNVKVRRYVKLNSIILLRSFGVIFVSLLRVWFFRIFNFF